MYSWATPPLDSYSSSYLNMAALDWSDQLLSNEPPYMSRPHLANFKSTWPSSLFLVPSLLHSILNWSLGFWKSIWTWSVFFHPSNHRRISRPRCLILFLKPPQGCNFDKNTKLQTDLFFNPSSVGQSVVDQMNSAISNLV